VAAGQRHDGGGKLDKTLSERSGGSKLGKSRVIITLVPGWDATSEVKKLGGKLGRKLSSINGQVAEVPNGLLRKLAEHPGVASIHWDRPSEASLNRAAVMVGARAVQSQLGYDGTGVGVAVIDSGITSWHDDLTYPGASTLVKTAAGQRVAKFVDFVNGRTSAYDDNGHGTHVAGIIAGNGRDSKGAHAGIAPGAHLVGLKVLDSSGRGVISDVIAAIEWATANRALYNIRVINLSVGAAVTESYKTDPLTLAAKRAVDAGLVVVTAAGNLGRNGLGQTQYGAITAPGNAPWVLTVGASSHEGTVKRTDDVVARYSSRGPTAIDHIAKPDLVAPGTGMVSLSDPTSTLYVSKAEYLLKGTLSLGYKPYLSLTGTSMSAPVVAGSVALMLQANPNLTPNLVKAILQYTAQVYDDYDTLTQGAGFLNTKGAVDLARSFVTAKAGERYPSARPWSQTINWGNHKIQGGVIKPNANAWGANVVWGSAVDFEGDNIVWGTLCLGECDNIVWGTLAEEDNIVWGTASFESDNIVWGTFRDEMDNIVWGTALFEQDNIVWGTDCEGVDCQSIVWGSSIENFGELDNIVWGTAELAEAVLCVGDIRRRGNPVVRRS
jgi:serine protease AprX